VLLHAALLLRGLPSGRPLCDSRAAAVQLGRTAAALRPLLPAVLAGRQAPPTLPLEILQFQPRQVCAASRGEGLTAIGLGMHFTVHILLSVLDSLGI